MLNRRTKIVATLGPASRDPQIIRELIRRGLDFARINASHGDHESNASLIAAVRQEGQAQGRRVGVLLDLQGPKIRLGAGVLPRSVVEDEIIELTTGPGDDTRMAVDHPHLCTDVSVGDPLIIDDGRVATEVVAVEGDGVRCRVLNDGEVNPRKGINLPASEVTAPSLTPKDRLDAAFAIEQRVDLIALSFVRRREDVRELARLIADAGSAIPIVAKIEKPQALDNLEGILDECWGVMVARGDLGVELPPEHVPMAQKEIIRQSNVMGRPVITATQMLDSMIRNPRPTRAETSDVANAVLDGSDAVMLSGETATGRYPMRAVEMMDRVIRATEGNHTTSPLLRRRERGIQSTSDAVADAGCQVARHLHARALVAFTRSGKTAILASKRRPNSPIIAYATTDEIANRLGLVWGVEPHQLTPSSDTDELVRDLDDSLIGNELASAGDRVVLLMGAPTWRSGITNLMVVHEVASS